MTHRFAFSLIATCSIAVAAACAAEGEDDDGSSSSPAASTTGASGSGGVGGTIVAGGMDGTGGSGACVPSCAAHETCCLTSGTKRYVCADTTSDGYHCGGCNIRCPLRFSCADSMCVPP